MGFARVEILQERAACAFADHQASLAASLPVPLLPPPGAPTTAIALSERAPGANMLQRTWRIVRRAARRVEIASSGEFLDIDTGARQCNCLLASRQPSNDGTDGGRRCLAIVLDAIICRRRYFGFGRHGPGIDIEGVDTPTPEFAMEGTHNNVPLRIADRTAESPAPLPGAAGGNRKSGAEVIVTA